MMGLPGYEAAFRARVDAVNAAAPERMDCTEPLIIPVAAHFQNTGIPLDCATDMALSQVATLNADFAATNSDIATWNALQPTIWPTISNAESCIQFCLATLDHPSGFGLQDGDYAVTLDATSGDFDAAWSGYLNFWVRTIGGGVLGYSPLGGTGTGDGVTVDPAYFGSVSCGGNTVTPPYNLGRTMTHEVGHYLLLEHPWGNGGCGSTDFVADTPVTDNPQFGCPAGQEIVNCTAPILWPSYMDYCDDACLFMFSAGQIARMETYVEQNLTNLLTHAVTACQEAACIGFDVDVSHADESCTGADGTISCATSGASPVTYSLDGPFTPPTASATGAFTGLSAGAYTLEVTDANGCTFSDAITLVREGPAFLPTAISHETCSDGAGSISVAVTEPTPFTFSLNGAPAVNSGTFTGLSAGTYAVVAANATGCAGTVSAVVLNESDLQVSVDARGVSCDWFDNGSIAARASGGTEPYLYALAHPWPVTSTTGEFTGLATGTYALSVADAAGCIYEGSFTLGTDFSVIGDDCPCAVFVPAAISPNNDGLNDALHISASCPMADIHLRIFDRWGRTVFESFDPADVWIGGVETHYVEPGIFGYVLEWSWGEAGNAGIRSESRSGTVAVVR
jgi:gliding motility-associated-like protein